MRVVRRRVPSRVPKQRHKPEGRSDGVVGDSVSIRRARRTTFFAICSLGDNIFVRGQVEGKVWTWTDEMTVDGKAMKIRATVTEDTPTSYSFKLEASMDGGAMVIEEGKATKG